MTNGRSGESPVTSAGRAGALAGRRVVVTRALEQNQELALALAALGAETILLPLVRFAAAPNATELDRAIGALAEFDWLVFTSANGVRFFLQRCRELGRWPTPDRPRIAVVGPATRDALAREGLRAERIPQQFGGAAVAAELGDGLMGRRVLLPRSDQARDELPSALRATGAMVTEVETYRTTEPESLDEAILERLRRGAADAILFFSPSAFHHFAQVAGGQLVSDVRAKGVAFAAVGPTTAAAIREAGAPVAVEAPAATTASLVAALAQYFAGRVTEKEGFR